MKEHAVGIWCRVGPLRLKTHLLVIAFRATDID